MLKVIYGKKFKRDFKLIIKRGYDVRKFEKVVGYLINEKPLPKRYVDHQLTNSREYKDVRECHIQPDWLLVYSVKDDTLTLELIRTGTHSDLF